MFDSLADRIREDEHKEVNQTERIVRWLVACVVDLVIWRPLYGRPNARIGRTAYRA